MSQCKQMDYASDIARPKAEGGWGHDSLHADRMSVTMFMSC